MVQTLIITLREGVEAALVIAIAIAYLRKIGRQDLLPAVQRAFITAVVASFGFAALLSWLHLGEDAYEGWTAARQRRFRAQYGPLDEPSRAGAQRRN